MSESIGWLKASALAFLFLLPYMPDGTAAASQEKSKARAESDPNVYYKKWLNEDVVYIITDEEREVFSKLASLDEKDQFIEQFWYRRDAISETSENEFKIEHYRRILYANEKFTAGIPGWKTDRGRIYIKFGPPDRMETNPAGGSYARPRKEGGGHTSVAPFEIWEYRHIPGVADDIELEFVDDKGGGLYELTFDPQRKDDLRQVGFLGPTLDEIEAYELRGERSKQDRVAGRRSAGDLTGNYANTAGFETHRDAPFAKLQLSANLNRAPVIKFKDLESVISTRISYATLPVDVAADFVRVSSNQVLVPVTIQVPNSAMTYQKQLGIYTGRLQVYGQVTTLTNRREAVFEDEIAKDFTEQTYDAGMRASSLFQKQLLLRPGLYKLELVVKDPESGKMSTLEKRLQVPEYSANRLALSSVMLAESIQKSDGPTDFRFRFGGLRVVPRLGAEFRKDEEMGFYFQVYGLDVDPSTQRPNAKVEFAMTPKGKDPSYWRDASDLLMFYRTHATVARIGSLSAFPPGDYELRLRITDHLSNQHVSATIPLSVLNPLPSKE